VWLVGLLKVGEEHLLATPTKIKGIKTRPFRFLGFPSPRLLADSICGL